ncbi:MAG: hypothetical protein ACLPWF_20560 [Bryobacteraceae bacterium]
MTDKPIKYVLNTRQHGDHSGVNAKMLAMNAEVISHRDSWARPDFRPRRHSQILDRISGCAGSHPRDGAFGSKQGPDLAIQQVDAMIGELK